MLLKALLRLTIKANHQIWPIVWGTVSTQYCQIITATGILSFLHVWVVVQEGVTVYKICPLVSSMLMCQNSSVGISPWTCLKMWFKHPSIFSSLSQHCGFTLSRVVWEKSGKWGRMRPERKRLYENGDIKNAEEKDKCFGDVGSGKREAWKEGADTNKPSLVLPKVSSGIFLNIMIWSLSLCKEKKQCQTKQAELKPKLCHGWLLRGRFLQITLAVNRPTRYLHLLKFP